MKNGYYITAARSGRELGVDGKIAAHIQLFARFFDMKHIEIPENLIYRKYLAKLPFFSSGRDFHQVLAQINNPSFIYIRRIPFEKSFIAFLGSVKKTYPKCKVLLELPTYPYDKDEYSKWYMCFSLKKDKKYREQLYDKVDAIVTYSKEKDIFDCHTINVANGVICESIEPVNDYSLLQSDIRLIAVARLRKHHGYERIIHGMADYYRVQRNTLVTFDIIGDGPEMECYKQLIKETQMERYIRMLGPVQPSQLVEYYNNSDIAISSLGFYKIGLNHSTNIKNREYMARGLPIICCCDDDAFVNNPYVQIVPNDDSYIDVEKIIDFYNTCYLAGKEKVVKEIRRIACQDVDIASTYKPVIDYICQ